MTNGESAARKESRPNKKLPGQDDACDATCEGESGPVREAGGTTGAGNLSPGQANRTGGATSGVTPGNAPEPSQRRQVPPGA